MRLVKVRCRVCHEIIEAEATMRGARVSPHKLPDGSDCAADGVLMRHELIDLADERPQWPDDGLDEEHVELLEDEDGGDYLARRGH